MTLRSVVGLQVRHSVLLPAAPVLALFGFVLAWGGSFPRIATQQNIASVVLSAVAVLAPVVAGLAAWDGIRDARHRGRPLIETAARPALHVMLTQCAAGCVLVTAAFLAMTAALEARALLYFTPAGPPPVLQLAVALVTLVVSAVCGSATAFLLGHWIAALIAPIAPLTAYGLALFPSGLDALDGVIPFGSRSAGDFLTPSPLFFAAQLLVVLGAGAAVLGLLTFTSAEDRQPAVIAAATGLVLLICGVTTLQVQQGRWGIPVADVRATLRPITSADGGLTLLVQPEYAPIAPDLLRTWLPVQNAFADTALPFDRLAHLTDDHGTVRPLDRLDRLYLNPSSIEPAPESVLATLADLRSIDCTDPWAVTMVDHWLAGLPGERLGLRGDEARRFAGLRALEPAEARAWMASHFLAYRSCSLTVADLPRG